MTSQVHAHASKQRTGYGSIPTSLDPTKQGLVDLVQICCAGDRSTNDSCDCGAEQTADH